MGLGVKIRRLSLWLVTSEVRKASALALSKQRLIQLNYTLATHAIEDPTLLPNVNTRSPT